MVHFPRNKRRLRSAADPVMLAGTLAAAATVLHGCADRFGGESVIVAIEPYEIASGFVGFVETPLSSGSGVRIAPDRLVTNAHVVEPFDEVRVVFGGQEEYAGAKVIGVDLIHDIALVGLGASGSAGSNGTATAGGVARVADPSLLPIGSDVFLVGFPGEVEPFPVAAISRGIISRHRRWERTNVGLVQTDADLSGGQSGGALVDHAGDVLGLSSMFFGDSGFAIALSMPDVIQIAEAIERGSLLLDPGKRGHQNSPSSLASVTEWSIEAETAFTIDTITREATFLVWPGLEDPANLMVRWEAAVDAAWVEVLDPFGSLIDRWDAETGDDELSLEIVSVGDGPHLVIVGMDGVGRGSITSDVPLESMVDPDDGITVRRGSTIVSALDAPGERDFYELVVEQGQSIDVIVDALSFEAHLTLESLDAFSGRPAQVGGVWSQNSLGLGSYAHVDSDSARGRRYRVTVGHIEDAVAGAYVLEVR